MANLWLRKVSGRNESATYSRDAEGLKNWMSCWLAPGRRSNSARMMESFLASGATVAGGTTTIFLTGSLKSWYPLIARV